MTPKLTPRPREKKLDTCGQFLEKIFKKSRNGWDFILETTVFSMLKITRRTWHFLRNGPLDHALYLPPKPNDLSFQVTLYRLRFQR